MAIKVTLFFELHRWGWSESYLDIADVELAPASVRVETMANRRIALCGAGVAMVGARVSKETRPGTQDTTGDSKLVDLFGTGKATGRILAEDVVPALAGEVFPDPAPSCVLLRGEDSTGRRRKSVFLSGIPDAIVRTMPLGPDLGLGAGWWARWVAWRTIMTAGQFGFWGRKLAGGATARQTVIGVQASGLVPNIMGVRTTNAGSLFAIGDRVQLKGFRHRIQAVHRWQGQWYVDSVTEVVGPPPTRIYFLRNSQLLDPDDVIKMGTVEGVEYEPITLTDLLIVRQANRKRGVGSAPPRGRLRPRRNFPAI